MQSGRTPLHLVAENKNLELFKYLFECGANPNITDKWNRKPHQVTRDRAFYEVVKQAVGDDPNESFYSILSRNSLNEPRSGRSSIRSQEGSFLKDPPLDVQRLLKNVNVSITDSVVNQIKVKPEQFENVSQSFQKQLKSITNILHTQEGAQISENPNPKTIRIRMNRSVAAQEKLPLNRKSNENAENQDPNTMLASTKEKNHRQSCDKPAKKHTLTNAILKNAKSPPLVGKQTFTAGSLTHEENNHNQNPFQMLKQSKQMPSISESDFRSPLNNMIGEFPSTQASSGNTNPSSNDRQVASTQLKSVQPFLEATKKIEQIKGSETEPTPGWLGGQDPNTSQFYTEMFDGNLSMSVDISREIKEERDVLDLLKALHTPKNPYIHAPSVEHKENPDLDSQIKQIFTQTQPDNSKVSAFQTGAETQEKDSEDSKSVQFQETPLIVTLDIGQWLSEIGLEEFTLNFTDNGYKTFNEFAQDFSKRASVDLIYKFGIDKAGHRARIMMKMKEGEEILAYAIFLKKLY